MHYRRVLLEAAKVSEQGVKSRSITAQFTIIT